MLLDDLLADRQPDARARILAAGVQALEHLKDPLGVLRVKADAVVAYGKSPVIAVPLGGDVNVRWVLCHET